MNQPLVHIDQPSFLNRWNIYFAERFPPVQHGILIASFCFGVLGYTASLSQPTLKLSVPSFLVAFLTSFLIILQLRILDEFKDFEEDSRWRPYRPVPRGLVSLASLRKLWFIAGSLQIAGAVMLDTRLLLGLFTIWIYSGLMGVEFFVPRWLKAHPITYMLSHIVIVPMIAAYVAACLWLPKGTAVPDLAYLLASSYFAFCVIEVGRKIRSPIDEETGVETYTFLWGLRGALLAWLGFMMVGSILAVFAAAKVQAIVPVAASLGLIIAICVYNSLAFLRKQEPLAGKHFNNLSGLWILVMFLILGISSMY